MDIDAADVFEAVAEFFHYEHRGECSAEREDVRPEAGRFICEMNEGEELSCTVGACLRVVGEVGEVALYEREQVERHLIISYTVDEAKGRHPTVTRKIQQSRILRYSLEESIFTFLQPPYNE